MIEVRYFTGKDGFRYRVIAHIFCEAFLITDTQVTWRIEIARKESRKKPHTTICEIEASDREPQKVKHGYGQPEYIPSEWFEYIRETQNALIERMKASMYYIQLKQEDNGKKDKD